MSVKDLTDRVKVVVHLLSMMLDVRLSVMQCMKKI